MELQNIQYTVKDHIAHIRFEGPNKYNIYTFELEAELRQIWDDVSCRDDIRGVIFSGQDTAFLTGTDLRSLNINDTNWMVENTARAQDLFNRIQNFQGPTIAAINGYVTGSGLELALACDFRFAAKSAIFAFPEVRMGIIPCVGGTQRLTRLIGIEHAKMMIFSGEKVSAKEAKQIGLVGRVVEPEHLLSEAEERMETMIENAPIAIANSKLCINLGSEMSLEQGLALERSTWLSLCMTEDAAEGIDAFLNKRKPLFKGR